MRPAATIRLTGSAVPRLTTPRTTRPAGEWLHTLLREEGASFQRLKTLEGREDPDYAMKKARAEHLYAIADGEVVPDEGEPEAVFCIDLCRHRNYAEGLAACSSLKGRSLAVARHSYRLSRKASI